MGSDQRGYAGELRELRERLLLMAGRVEQMIEDSVRAFIEHDRELARATIAVDREVNRDEMDADELCLNILSRFNPQGSDLRFITRALKMVTDIERIGDLAVNICERVIHITGTLSVRSYEGIPEITRLVQGMIRGAIDAFVEGDVERARQVVHRDDLVDELYRRFYRDLVAQMVRQEVDIELGVHIHAVAKFLERMADHGTNIAEEVIFMVKGKDIRHAGKGGDSPLGDKGGGGSALIH